MKKFKLGQKVIVNTGGKDSLAFIDYPTIRYKPNGDEYSYIFKNSSGYSYLCRFTDNEKHCHFGGAKISSDSSTALARNAQFIPEQYIKPFEPVEVTK